MAKYLAKRIGILLITLFIVVTATFFLMKLLPGTPLANAAKLSPEQQALIAKQYGLNQPVMVQYWNYLVGLLHGNMGYSFQYSNQPVSFLIGSRIGVSIQLGLQALVFGVVLGTIIGAVSAVKKNGWEDTSLSVIAILGISIPSFVFAVILQYWLALKAGWFPIAGWDGLQSTILPTIALGMGPLATAARFIRTEMVDVLSSDYIELSRAKGLTKREIIMHHALRNSLIPLVTLIGPLAVNLLTGSMVVENIFAVPGIGNQFVQSILTLDYPTILATTIVYALMLMVVLLITDILYGVIDPRIRLTGKKGA